MGIESRASYLLGKCSTTCTTPSAKLLCSPIPLVVQWTESKSLHMLGKCSAVELYPLPEPFTS
jgi:hypothetical protein